MPTFSFLVQNRANRIAAVLGLAFVFVWAFTGVGGGRPRFAVQMIGSAGTEITGPLPAKLSADAPGIPETPGFAWNNVPSGTRSLALVVRGKSGNRSVYSVLYNIDKYRPISYDELREVQFEGRTPVFTAGINDFGGDYEYFMPPNPAAGESVSLDVTLYALSTRELQGGLTADALLVAIKGSVLATANARYTYRSKGLVIELIDRDDSRFAPGALLSMDYSPYEPGVPASPGIGWYGASGAAGSLALVVRDASFGNAVHSLLYNIDPSLPIPFNEIAAAQAASRLPAGVGAVGVNDYAADYPVYAPPFPPQVEQHTYVFTLYALAGPDLAGGLTLAQFEAATVGRVLQRATATVKFKAPAFTLALRNQLGAAFARNAQLPVAYSGYSASGPVSPAIDWEYPPLDASFLALLVTDDTIGAVHALVYNLDPAAPLAYDRLTSDQRLGGPYAYGVGINDFASDYAVYTPPAPPLGERHKYTYTVIAYSGAALAGGLDLAGVDAALAGRVIASRSSTVYCALPKSSGSR